MNCPNCSKEINQFERINDNGTIKCGHCFTVKEPVKKVITETVEHVELPSVEQLMEAIVSLDDRLLALEKKVEDIFQSLYSG